MIEFESGDPFEWNWPTDLESPDGNQRRDAVTHAQIENDHAPDELAIFDVSGKLAENAWVSASGESFVDLDDAR